MKELTIDPNQVIDGGRPNINAVNQVDLLDEEWLSISPQRDDLKLLCEQNVSIEKGLSYVHNILECAPMKSVCSCTYMRNASFVFKTLALRFWKLNQGELSDLVMAYRWRLFQFPEVAYELQLPICWEECHIFVSSLTSIPRRRRCLPNSSPSMRLCLSWWRWRSKFWRTTERFSRSERNI